MNGQVICRRIIQCILVAFIMGCAGSPKFSVRLPSNVAMVAPDGTHIILEGELFYHKTKDGLELYTGNPEGMSEFGFKQRLMIKDGKKHGTYTKWYPDNDQKYGEAHYEKNVKHGDFKMWYPDGKLKQHRFYEAGKLTSHQEWLYDGTQKIVSEWNPDGTPKVNPKSITSPPCG